MRSLRAAGFAQQNGNGTQEAQSGYKKHKKDLILRIFCAFCALICAFCVPFPFRWAKPRRTGKRTANTTTQRRACASVNPRSPLLWANGGIPVFGDFAVVHAEH